MAALFSRPDHGAPKMDVPPWTRPERSEKFILLQSPRARRLAPIPASGKHLYLRRRRKTDISSANSTGHILCDRHDSTFVLTGFFKCSKAHLQSGVSKACINQNCILRAPGGNHAEEQVRPALFWCECVDFCSRNTGSVSPAQTAGTGALRGTVTDSTGAVVPNATVTATSTDTGQVRTATTGTDGVYTSPCFHPANMASSLKRTASKRRKFLPRRSP